MNGSEERNNFEPWQSKVREAVEVLGQERDEERARDNAKNKDMAARKRTENKESLDLKVQAQTRLLVWHLRDHISLLGMFSVFLLCNVDSYTRDDLMSLVTLKLCSHVVRPGLIMEKTALQALAQYFEGLHLSEAVMRKMAEADQEIVRSKRSGEWLLTDLDYRKYLEGDVRKQAEPLSQIVKLKTIAMGMSGLYRVEGSLQSLSLLLRAEGRQAYSSDLFHQETSRRTSFFEGLLELANACARSVLAQPLEDAFIRMVKDPISKDPVLRELKDNQQHALAMLQQEELAVSERAASRTYEASFASEEGVQRKVEEAFRELLFERLRLLCIFQLQLVNISSYNLTGKALKLTALASHPTDFSQTSVSCYWLLRAHELLSSLGYDLKALRAFLDLWVPRDGKEAPSLLLAPGHTTLAEARSLFHEARLIFAHVGATPKTKTLLEAHFPKRQISGESSFVRLLAEFARGFPAPQTSSGKPRAEERCREDRLGRLISPALNILNQAKEEDAEGYPVHEARELDAIMCKVISWFEEEQSFHSRHNREWKGKVPDHHEIPSREQCRAWDSEDVVKKEKRDDATIAEDDEKSKKKAKVSKGKASGKAVPHLPFEDRA